MRDPKRFLYLAFQIDANRINSRQSLEAMNRLENWDAAGLIDVMISEAAQKEAASGSVSRMEKAYSYIFSMSEISTSQESSFFEKIERILWPDGAQNQNQRNDVDIVFNASKYGRILVTNDGASKTQPGGILGHRKELADLGIKVMTDEEAVEHVREAIRLRDDGLKKISRLSGVARLDRQG
jgi:hypothetical protein